jgi:hypothetical protein
MTVYEYGETLRLTRKSLDLFSQIRLPTCSGKAMEDELIHHSGFAEP